MIKRVQNVVQRNVSALRQRGSFARNFAVTFSGTAAVAALGFLVSPLMTRLYAPATYGLFAVFSSLVANVTLFSSLSYPSAFLLPRLQKRFHALVQLSFLLALLMLVLMSVVVLLFKNAILQWLHAEALGNWLYVVPVTVFIYSLMMVMNSWYLRTKDFQKRAGIDVVTSVAGRSLTLAAGVVLHGNVTGLLLGDIFAKVTGAITMLFSGIHRQVSVVARSFSWARVKAVAYEYREYPFYVTPTGYLNTLAAQLPIIFLTTTFGTSSVGLYSFSSSLLELPINLIGNAVAPVFLQKATETHEQNPERMRQLCLELYYKLLYLGLIPFGIITVFGDWIFSFVFGSQWEQAGEFTAYLGYYYVFKLASYATSPIYAVLRRQRLMLLGTGLLLLARAAALGIGALTHDLHLGMLLFGVGSLVVTFLVDMNILYLLRLPVWRVAFRSLGLIALTLVVLYGLRQVLAPLMP